MGIVNSQDKHSTKSFLKLQHQKKVSKNNTNSKATISRDEYIANYELTHECGVHHQYKAKMDSSIEYTYFG